VGGSRIKEKANGGSRSSSRAANRSSTTSSSVGVCLIDLVQQAVVLVHVWLLVVGGSNTHLRL
jgi:hypothetical protein